MRMNLVIGNIVNKEQMNNELKRNEFMYNNHEQIQKQRKIDAK